MEGKRGRPMRQRNPMTLKEIRLLLLLKEWSREKLAKELGITRNTVDRWFCVAPDQQRHPNPEQIDLMRAWLKEARRLSERQ